MTCFSSDRTTFSNAGPAIGSPAANGSPLVASLETPAPADPIALQIAASNGDVDDSDDDR